MAHSVENKGWKIENHPYVIPEDWGPEINTVLEPVQVIEFDEASRYLLVFRPHQRVLSKEASERLAAQLKEELADLLDGIRFRVLVLDEPAELQFYQFKKSDDGESRDESKFE